MSPLIIHEDSQAILNVSVSSFESLLDEIYSMGGHERNPAYTKVSQCTKWRWAGVLVEMHRTLICLPVHSNRSDILPS